MYVQVVNWPERRFVAGVFTAPPGKFRMLFEYDDKLRALCWLDVGKDGRLYLNLRQDGTTRPFMRMA